MSGMEYPEWVSRVRNPELFKAATLLSSVRSACLALTEKGVEAGAAPPCVGVFEMRLLSDALNSIRNLYGSWEKFPFPSFSEAEAREWKAHPASVLTYCDILLAHLAKNAASLEK